MPALASADVVNGQIGQEERPTRSGIFRMFRAGEEEGYGVASGAKLAESENERHIYGGFGADVDNRRSEREARCFARDDVVHGVAVVGQKAGEAIEEPRGLLRARGGWDAQAERCRGLRSSQRQVSIEVSGRGSGLWLLRWGGRSHMLTVEFGHGDVTVGIETDSVALIQGPHADRSRRGDDQLNQNGIVAHERTGEGACFEEDGQRMARGRLIHLALQRAGARGRFPVDAARLITWLIGADAGDAEGVFQQAARRLVLAERRV